MSLQVTGRPAAPPDYDEAVDPVYDEGADVEYDQAADPDYDEGRQREYETDVADADAPEVSQEYYKRSQK